MKRKWIVAAIGAALVSGAAWAQWGPGMGGGYGMSPGMMGGGEGGCAQMGPGTMGNGGGRGMGPGMMGGGMMGGGMMGGGMMGGGMMGGAGWGYQALDLSDAQRDKIASATRDLREKQWGLMRTMHELMWKSESPGSLSDAEILKNFDGMTAVRREMLASRLEARKRIDEVLTKEQRAQLDKYRNRGW